METEDKGDNLSLDFKNTEIAFRRKTNGELKEMQRIFRLMNNKHLVNLGSLITPKFLHWNIPFTKFAIRKTIFKQFCGGENLLDCQQTIEDLMAEDSLTILDYGAESKELDDELDLVKLENLKAIDFAASNTSVPVISIKVTGLGPNQILEDRNKQNNSVTDDNYAYEQMLARVDEICAHACELGVGVFIDAEESWVQNAIDEVVDLMMERYNKEKVIVYNTYQLYRKDKLEQLKADYTKAIQNGYLIGAKLVRGAYMEKEREYALENNIECVIQNTKEDTDRDYNNALEFCLDRYDQIGFCCASHNVESSQLLAKRIHQEDILKSHPHINFCQLYGMSDNLSFNLSNAGYNVAKYLPYGPLKEVIPYLIRRAQENTSVDGDVSRELNFINQELKRRSI